MTVIVFLDTETTGLKENDEIWEFGAVRREEDGTETEHHFFVKHSKFKCGSMPDPFFTDHNTRYIEEDALEGRDAYKKMREITADAVVVGTIIDFDIYHMRTGMRKHGLVPKWKGLLSIDKNILAYLYQLDPENVRYLTDVDSISAKFGVEPPVEDRHTAMGDARWAIKLFDELTKRIS